MTTPDKFKGIIEAFRAKLGKDALLETSEDPRDVKTLTVKVQPEKILACAELMKEKDFPYLSFITAVDFKKHLEMVYWFTSISTGLNVRVKCNLDSVNPKIESLTDLFSVANWNEREVYDLFGVNFTGHPNLKRILTWDEFEGHPLLKKYKVIDDPDEFPTSPEIKTAAKA